MHEVLRQRLWRHIEALPEAQLYQALDFIEFLSSKYAREAMRPTSGLQRFGERLEDKMRGQGLGLRAIRGTLDAMGAADRMVSGIADAGRSILCEVEAGLSTPAPAPALGNAPDSAPPSGGADERP